MKIPLKIGAIIAAAGKSERMGKPKLLLPLGHQPLFTYVCKLASQLGLNPITLIVGEHAEEMRQSVTNIKNISIVLNPYFNKGMATSLKLGVETMENKVDAVLIFLADQPFIPKLVVDSLIRSYQQNQGMLIIRPSFQGKPGHPVLFSSLLFPAFHELQGDEGAKRIIQKYHKQLQIIPFHHPFWGYDIDTPEDYQKMQQYVAKNTASLQFERNF